MNNPFRIHLLLWTLSVLSLILPAHAYAMRPQPDASGLEERLATGKEPVTVTEVKGSALARTAGLEEVRRAQGLPSDLAQFVDGFSNSWLPESGVWEPFHFSTRLMLEAVELLKPIFSNAEILDTGTGSGILVLNALTRLGARRGVATDIYQPALDEVRANAHRLKVPEEKLEVLEGDLLDPVQGRLVDVALFNAPSRVHAEAYVTHVGQVLHEDGIALLMWMRDAGQTLRAIAHQHNLSILRVLEYSDGWSIYLIARNPERLHNLATVFQQTQPDRAGLEETQVSEETPGLPEAAERVEEVTAQPDEVKRLPPGRDEAIVEFRFERPVDFDLHPPASPPIAQSGEDRFWIWSEPLQMEPAHRENLRAVFSRIRSLSAALDQGEPLHAVFWASGPTLTDPSRGNFLGLLVGHQLVASPTARYYLLPDPEIHPLIRHQLGWEPSVAIPVIRRRQAVMEARKETSLLLRLSRTSSAGLEDRLRSAAGLEQAAELTLEQIRQARSWADLFGNDRPVAWEIGFLPGWALESRAIYQPDWNFLGIDLLSSTQLESWDPQTIPENVRWIFAGVRQVEEASRHLGSLKAIFIDFPPVGQGVYPFDPPELLPQLLRRLEPGGEFSLRTESTKVLERFEQAIRLSGDPRPFERPVPSSKLEWPITPFALKLSQSPSPAAVYTVRYWSPLPGPLDSLSEPSKAGLEGAALRLRVQRQLTRITHDQTLHWQIAGPSVADRYRGLKILAHYLRHFEIDPGGQETGAVVEELAAQGERVTGVTYYGTQEEHENFRTFASRKGISAGEKPVSPRSGDFQGFLQQLLSNLVGLPEEGFPAWATDKGAALTQLAGDVESLASLEALLKAT